MRRAGYQRGPLELTVFLISIAVSYTIALQANAILPAKFLLDDPVIQRNIASFQYQGHANSYGVTALLYRWAGLGNAPVLVAILAVSMAVACVFVALPRLRDGWSWPTVFAASGTVLVAGIYLGKYTKEFWNLPIIFVFLLALRRRSVALEITAIAMIVAYASFVRSYWFLILALYLGFRIMSRWITSRRRFIGVALLALIALVIVFNVVLGLPATAYRTALNDDPHDIDRATMITDFITSRSSDLLPITGVPRDLLNLILTTITLFIPIPLLLAGSAVHAISAVALAVMWVTLAFVASDRIKQRRAAPGLPITGQDKAIAWLIAFVITQSLFEPDYGSALRHLLPSLPLAVYLIATSTRFGFPQPTTALTAADRAQRATLPEK
ncbi:MAG: hypothetical protein JWO10_734 [Microbacteriaceae bacterium]|nr:hypothetical protein [Microbacteriaceae bacterium]